MEQKKLKVYPYLIDENRMAGYYELLLEDKFKMKKFDKKKDKDVYNYFMPSMRDYLFWSYNLNSKEEIEEYNNLKNDLKAAICSRYTCNIFEKNNVEVICFDTGVCFAITEDKKVLNKLTEYKDIRKMEEINLRSEDAYEIKDSKDTHKYSYILQLYKLIYLNKANKELQNPNLFDKVRNQFVDFTQKVYIIKETDKDKYNEELKEEFDLEKIYLSVENQFDLLYKNNKLNENMTYKRLIVILLVIFIIIGAINLGNWWG